MSGESFSCEFAGFFGDEDELNYHSKEVTFAPMYEGLTVTSVIETFLKAYENSGFLNNLEITLKFKSGQDKVFKTNIAD